MMKKTVVFGTGVIGTAWGAVFLKGGCDVVFYDIAQEKLDETKKNLEGVMNFFVSIIVDLSII